MKKIIFSIIATAFVFLQANAQIKQLNEKERLNAAKAILTFTQGLKSAYVVNDTFESFQQKVCDTKTISVDGIIVLKKGFYYIKNNSTDESILKEESGKEITQAYNNFSALKNGQSFEFYLLGTNDLGQFKGGFWRWLKEAIEWLGCCSDGVYCCNGN